MSAGRDDVAGVFADWDARDARQAAEDADRARLAATLAGTSVRVDFAGLITNMEARRIAEVLLPVVQALVAEGAAAELRAAADGAETGTWRDPITGPDVAAMLRALAAALTAGSEAGT